MKNILLVDTNFSSIPIYEWLVGKGFNVFFVGNNLNDFMAKSMPGFIKGDYSDSLFLADIINKYKIDRVIPGCNDHSYEACSKLFSHPSIKNIDGQQTTQTIINKKKFREYSRFNGLPVPRTYDLSTLSHNFPEKGLIVKPVDAFSGKGITRVFSNKKERLDEAILYAKQFSKNRECVIEEFVSGELYSHSAFIENKKIIKDFVVKEFGSVNPYVVDTSHVCYTFPVLTLEKIREQIEILARKLNFSDGLVHTQFILQGEKFWFIELTRRCPGDLYSQLIELSTGYPYAQKYTSYFISEGDNIPVVPGRGADIIRHTLTQENSGFFYSIDFMRNLKMLRYVNIALAGDFLEPSPKGRVAISFVEANSPEDLQDLVKCFIARQVYAINFVGSDRGS